MTAAARETPEMELMLGSRERTKWQEAKIMMKYVSLMSLHLLSQITSWNFFSDLPPVTMKTMSPLTSTMSCCGTTIHSPSF